MKRVLVAMFLVIYTYTGYTQSIITKIKFEDIRKKGNNVYADIITKEFYNTLKTYKVYKLYPHGIFLANDLSDTTNQLVKQDDTLKITNGHIYHIYAPFTYHKVSIIMIVQDDSLFFFKGLNCCRPKHTLSDVLYWVSTRQNNFDRIVFDRIANYNHYYYGIPIDIPGAFCECSNKSIHSKKKHKKPHQIIIKNKK